MAGWQSFKDIWIVGLKSDDTDLSVQVTHAATLWSALVCRKTLRIFSKCLNTFHSALLKISVMLEVIYPISGAENLKNILFILRNIHFSSCVGLLTTEIVWICFACFYRGVKAMACLVSLLWIVGHSVTKGDITDLEEFLGKLFPGRGQELWAPVTCIGLVCPSEQSGPFQNEVLPQRIIGKLRNWQL